MEIKIMASSEKKKRNTEPTIIEAAQLMVTKSFFRQFPYLDNVLAFREKLGKS